MWSTGRLASSFQVVHALLFDFKSSRAVFVWTFPIVDMSASSNHDRYIVDALQTLGALHVAIAWCQSQGLETCSDGNL